VYKTLKQPPEMNEIWNIAYMPHLTRIFLQTCMELWIPVFGDRFSMKCLMVVGYVHWYAVKELQNDLVKKGNPKAFVTPVPDFSVCDALRDLNLRWDGVTSYSRAFVDECFHKFVEEDYIELVGCNDGRIKKYKTTNALKGLCHYCYEKTATAANLITAQRQNEISAAKAVELGLAIEEVLGVSPDWSRKNGAVNIHGNSIQPQPLQVLTMPKMNGSGV